MKSLNVLVAGSLLLTLVSCGEKSNSSSNSDKLENPVCSDASCLSSVNWRIQLQGKNFPDRARIDVDGTTVLNECISKQRYYIDRNSNPQHIYLESYYPPAKSTAKIEVYDLGNCNMETKIFSDDNLNYELNKKDKEIVINI